MAEKKSVEIKTFWFSDVLVMPKFVTIITSIDKHGAVNAAPYSIGAPYNIGKNSPQILLGIRKGTHTFKNILETKEFVVNFPSWDYVRETMETARFWPASENELEHTCFTEIPSKRVMPPSIRQCKQHIECRLHEVIETGTGQHFIIGDIVDIVVDEALIAMGRAERIRALDLPVFLGDEKKKYFYYGRTGETAMFELEPVEKACTEKVVTNMVWEDAARQAMEMTRIPSSIQEMVVEVIEDEARKSGADKVTYASFRKIADEYTPKEFQERLASFAL